MDIIIESLAIDGLGYVRNPSIAPNLSVIGVFHQLHCLVSCFTVGKACEKNRLKDQ